MTSTASARTSSAVFTIPNAISALRLLGVPVFVWLVIGLHADVAALILLMVSGITDWADGYLARRLDQISTLGALLDPIADRLYIVAVVVGLAWRDFIPWWMVVVLLLRDLMLWTLVPFLRSRGYSALPVHYVGKAATFCLLYAFPLLFIARGHGTVSTIAEVLGWAFAFWGIGLYWCAGLTYALQVRRLMRETEPLRRPRRSVRS